MSDEIDYDAICEEYNNLPCKQGHFLAPKWPFMMIISGPTGCGKSTVVLDLIVKYLYFDRLYIFANEQDEDKYEFIREFMQEIANKREVHLNDILFIGGYDDIPSPSAYDPEYQNLVVFDDMVTERDQKKIEETYTFGRKRNCSVIYITQSFIDVPKIIRKQSKYFVIFSVSDEEAMNIRKKAGSRLPQEDFLKTFHEATDNLHDWLLIDNKTPDLPLAFRKKLTGLLDASKLSGR